MSIIKSYLCFAVHRDRAPRQIREGKKCLPICDFHLTMFECRSCNTLGCFFTGMANGMPLSLYQLSFAKTIGYMHLERVLMLLT